MQKSIVCAMFSRKLSSPICIACLPDSDVTWYVNVVQSKVSLKKVSESLIFCNPSISSEAISPSRYIVTVNPHRLVHAVSEYMLLSMVTTFDRQWVVRKPVPNRPVLSWFSLSSLYLYSKAKRESGVNGDPLCLKRTMSTLFSSFVISILTSMLFLFGSLAIVSLAFCISSQTQRFLSLLDGELSSRNRFSTLVIYILSKTLS